MNYPLDIKNKLAEYQTESKRLEQIGDLFSSARIDKSIAQIILDYPGIDAPEPPKEKILGFQRFTKNPELRNTIPS